MENIIKFLFISLFCVYFASASDLVERASSSPYSIAKTVPWTPQKATSVDQSVIINGTYYLSDRTNDVVHAINITSGASIAEIGGWKGTVLTSKGKVNDTISGPNGLLALPDRNELYVGDAGGIVGVISLTSNTRIANISVGGAPFRADEMAYDPKAGFIAVTTPDAPIAFVSIISAANHSVLGHIFFPNADGGLEQPAFNHADGKFYVSVPSTVTNPGGEIAVLDISSFAIAKTLTLSQVCPVGIVFGPTPHLFIAASDDQVLQYNTSNSVVLDYTTGKVVANISNLSGIDQVAYDPMANLYFAAAYQNVAGGNGSAPAPILGVIDAGTNKLVQSIVTDNVTAHSVAVDTMNNVMVVPVSDKGIEIYGYSGTGTNGSSNSSSTGSGTGSGASASGKPSGAETSSVFWMLIVGCAGLVMVVGHAI